MLFSRCFSPFCSKCIQMLSFFCCSIPLLFRPKSTNSATNDKPFPDRPMCRSDQKRIYGVARNEQAKILCEVDSFPPPTSFKWSFNNTAETIDMPQNGFEKYSRTSSKLTYTPVKVCIRCSSTKVYWFLFDYLFRFIRTIYTKIYTLMQLPKIFAFCNIRLQLIFVVKANSFQDMLKQLSTLDTAPWISYMATFTLNAENQTAKLETNPNIGGLELNLQSLYTHLNHHFLHKVLD